MIKRLAALTLAAVFALPMAQAHAAADVTVNDARGDQRVYSDKLAKPIADASDLVRVRYQTVNRGATFKAVITVKNFLTENDRFTQVYAIAGRPANSYAGFAITGTTENVVTVFNASGEACGAKQAVKTVKSNDVITVTAPVSCLDTDQALAFTTTMSLSRTRNGLPTAKILAQDDVRKTAAIVVK